jgi:hypothetical protein
MRKPLVLFLIYRRLRDGNLEQVLSAEKTEEDGDEIAYLRRAAGYGANNSSRMSTYDAADLGKVSTAIGQLLVANSRAETELVAYGE